MYTPHNGNYCSTRRVYVFLSHTPSLDQSPMTCITIYIYIHVLLYARVCINMYIDIYSVMMSLVFSFLCRAASVLLSTHFNPNKRTAAKTARPTDSNLLEAF